VAAFKDRLDKSAVERIGAAISSAWPGFDQDAFVREAAAGLAALELKARVARIADVLRLHLPDDLRAALAILTAALGPPGAPSGGDFWGPEDAGHLTGFLVWPLTHLVAEHGGGQFDASMAALEEMTRRFTAEFAVRPFAAAEPERTIALALRWAASPDQHLRRLASEGLRPRLPWGMQLKQFVKDPTPVLPVLEALKDDPEPYVRTSVANHLNDISRDHPDLVVALGRRWLEAPTPARRWILKRGCRTLIKQGHRGALALLGYAVPPALVLEALELEPSSVAVGGVLNVRVRLRSTARRAQRLAVDYVLHLQRAGGKTSEKVWKGGDRTLKAGEVVDVVFRRPLPAVTTRTYHPGGHDVELLVNGERLGRARFELRVP
jgi:3-methyladenine DNA glycosylase AlkC